MFHLKFSAFLLFTLCFIQYCVCDANETACTIEDKIATCESNVDFKTLQDTNITKLIVRSDKLQRINKDDFALYVNLEEIDLSDCALEEIDGNAFVTLSKLHKINLSGNKKLKTVTITSDTITCLNVSNTGIEDLGDMFKHLPKLHNLDLSGTPIKDFSQLEHLEHLAKLVVSKTNETLELCNVLSVKELTLIEKDNDGIETPLDCKTKKEDIKTEDETKTEIPKIPEIKEENTSTEIPQKKDEEVTEAPIIASTIKAENTSKVTPEIVPKIAPKMAQNIDKKIEETTVTNEVNKTEVPKLLHESSANENEATTISILTEEKHEYAINKMENETVTEATLKNEGETMKKEDETPKQENAEPKQENEAPKKDKEAPKQENEETKIEVETTKPEVNQPKKERKTAQISEANKKESSEKPQVVLDSDDVILPSTEKASQANGVNIVLGIILCVMVVGAVGFGFKYWKNRRSGYTHANTHDHEDEEKELQTIVAHRTDPEQN